MILIKSYKKYVFQLNKTFLFKSYGTPPQASKNKRQMYGLLSQEAN